ncbi:MAG TPA: hypothetical protein VGE46_00245 [Bdellovibrio sp.]
MTNNKSALQADHSLNNLLYFIRISALGLLLLTLFVESKVGSSHYHVLDILFMLKGGWLNIPLLPGMSAAFASFGWFPVFIEIFSIFALLLLFFKPASRLSYVLAISALLLRNVASHLTVGVHTASIFLVPLLLLALDPPRQENSGKVRQRLIVAIALMYLFSAFFKLNQTFLSGTIVEKSFLYRLSLKSFLDWVAAFKVTVLLGPALEFFAFFMIFRRTRKFALACALLFHFVVSIWIFLSVGLAIFGCSILLLFNQEQDLKLYYRRLVFVSGTFTALLYGLNYQVLGNFQHFQASVYDAVSIGMAALAMFWAFSLLVKFNIEPINYVSKWGSFLPVAYVTLSFTLSWPEPFGYTQYAGLPAPSYVTVLSLHEVRKHPQVYSFARRWRTRSLRFYESNEFVAIFPTQAMTQNFIQYYAQLEPRCEYKSYVSPAGGNFENLVYDYAVRRQAFDSLPLQSCSLSPPE